MKVSLMGVLALRYQKQDPKSSRRRVGPIGLDCALERLHLVQLESANGVISVHAKASLAYPEPLDALQAASKKMRDLIQQALKSDCFGGRHVVTRLPSADARIMPVTYHAANDQTAEAALLKVIGERIDGDLLDYVIDYLPIRSDSKSEECLAIVAIAERRRVIDYLEMLRKAGLAVDRLEIGPTAIRRLVSAMGKADEQENVLALNCGRTSSYLSVISGARLIFDQEIRFGEMRMIDDIARALEITQEAAQSLVSSSSFAPVSASARQAPYGLDVDASETLQQIVKPAMMNLAEEINRTLIYTASQTRGEPISRIYLLGSLARWQGMDDLLGTLIRLPVVIIPNPLKPFDRNNGISAQNNESIPEIAVATGLALSGLQDDGRN
jgi:type IV pilus assembly protein PilM